MQERDSVREDFSCFNLQSLLRMIDFDLGLIEEELCEECLSTNTHNEIILDLNNHFSLPFGVPEKAHAEIRTFLLVKKYRVLEFTTDHAIRIMKNRFNNLV